VVVKSFARIHWQNLINFGVLPLTFVDASDYDQIEQGDILEIKDLHNAIQAESITLLIKNKNKSIAVEQQLSERQKEMLLAGSLINWARD